MGECGCASGNTMFKLKAPDGWYVIELLAGCSYCCDGPGIQVHHPESMEYLDDVEHMPDLPIIGYDGECCVTMIKCGLNTDEIKSAAVKCFTGSSVENGQIDEVLAEILGEDLWKDVLSNSPSVIYPENEGEKT